MSHRRTISGNLRVIRAGETASREEGCSIWRWLWERFVFWSVRAATRREVPLPRPLWTLPCLNEAFVTDIFCGGDFDSPGTWVWDGMLGWNFKTFCFTYKLTIKNLASSFDWNSHHIAVEQGGPISMKNCASASGYLWIGIRSSLRG